MTRIARLLVCVSSLLAAQSAAAQAGLLVHPATHLRVVAYVASWSMPAVIHADELTDINFAFARIEAGGTVSFEHADDAVHLIALLALKKENPALKILVSVGGWQAEGFSDAALTTRSRAIFARSAVELLRRYGLDGIDLDWE